MAIPILVALDRAPIVGAQFHRIRDCTALIVSVIPQPQPPASLLQPFHETAQELASGCAQYEQALSDLFSDVDRMRAELEVHLQSVLREQCELRTRQADQSAKDQDDTADAQHLRSELEDRDRRLSQALDDLQAVREELERERHEAHEQSAAAATSGVDSEQLQGLQEALASAHAERDALLSERDTWRQRAEQTRSEQDENLARLEQELTDVRTALIARDNECEAAQSELQATRTQLTEVDAQLVDARAQLADTREQLANSQGQLADSRGQFVVAQGELADARKQLTDTQDLHVAARSQLAEFEAQVAETQKQLAEAQRQADEARNQLADSQSDCVDTRKRLAAAQRQMAELESQLTELRSQLENSQRVAVPTSPEPVDSSTLATMTQEREALEAELELVRSQAAELHETVRQQQHEMVTQKSELGGELQQLRRLVEKQADLIADRAVSTGRETVTQTVAATPGNMSLPNDPVVNSVMAQFAKLQKDVAQRRRRKP